MNKLTMEDEEQDGTRHLSPFAVSMYLAMLVVSQTGFGDITAYNVTEMFTMFVYFIIGTLMFSYLVADYSATLMLSARAKWVGSWGE